MADTRKYVQVITFSMLTTKMICFGPVLRDLTSSSL